MLHYSDLRELACIEQDPHHRPRVYGVLMWLYHRKLISGVSPEYGFAVTPTGSAELVAQAVATALG